VLYLFDEPRPVCTSTHRQTAGRVERLLHKGASLLIIEHNLEVIRHARLDHDSMRSAGCIVVEGTPETMACLELVHRRFLRPLLAERAGHK